MSNNPLRKEGYSSTKIPEKEFPIGKDGKRDYLQVDPPLPGQSWVCVSFVSPEDMIQKRNLYYFNQFLYREVNKTLKDQSIHMAKEINSMLRKAFEKKIEKLKKSHNEAETVAAGYVEDAYKTLQLDEEEFANKCMHLYRIDYDEVHDKFSMFQTQNAVEMDKKFDEENDFRTSVRGFKIRGVFNERKEAEQRCKDLREQVEPVHVYVAPVGYWCPWDPDPDAVQDSDYMLPALNELMGKYHENVRQKNKFFEERKQEMMGDAEMSNRDRIKQRIRQKMLDRQQAKIEQELKQKRLEKEIAQQTPEDFDKLVKELEEMDKSRKNKNKKGNQNQNNGKKNKNKKK